MASIRVGIVGVGNCASSLVQGVHYYRNASDDEFVPGIMHANFGGYRIRDIEFVAAFDVDARKVGKDLAHAIFTEPNCTKRFANPPELGVEVMRGQVLDGIGEYLRKVIPVDEYQESVDVAGELRKRRAEILINYLPVGSHRATEFYAGEAIRAGCALVNCIPEFIASDPLWQGRFVEAGLPVAGDDVKSQIGATILHRVLTQLFVDRGVKVEKAYQLNIGGNTDFLNMQEQSRLTSKRISKTKAVQSVVGYEFPVRIGPSDYVEFLKDNKIAMIYIEGKKFGDVPVTIDIKLSVEDSPNSAGIVVDAVRAVKIALDRRIAGPLTSVSSYFFKHPPEQHPDYDAKRMVEEFIEGKRER